MKKLFRLSIACYFLFFVSCQQTNEDRSKQGFYEKNQTSEQLQDELKRIEKRTAEAQAEIDIMEEREARENDTLKDYEHKKQMKNYYNIFELSPNREYNRELNADGYKLYLKMKKDDSLKMKRQKDEKN